MQRREGFFLQAPTLPSHFQLLLLPSHFCPSVSNTFSLHLLLLKQKKKENKEKNHKEEKKCREGEALSFKLPLCPLTFGSHFWPLISALLFQALSLQHILFLKQKEKKHKKEKKWRKGREISFKLPCCPFIFGFRFCPLISTFLFQTLSPNIFFLSKRKKNQNKTKCRKGKEFTSKLSLYLLSFGSYVWSLVSSLLFQAFSPWHLLIFKQKKRKKNTKKKNAKKGKSLPFFSHFYIWDEMFLLLFPFHTSLTLRSTPSSILVSHVSLKSYVIQAWEFSQALEME